MTPSFISIIIIIRQYNSARNPGLL
jgi:hypothetical protein